MNNALLTQWYGPDVLPGQPGVFEVDWIDLPQRPGEIVRQYSYWNGVVWAMPASTPAQAHDLRFSGPRTAVNYWRGHLSAP